MLSCNQCLEVFTMQNQNYFFIKLLPIPPLPAFNNYHSTFSVSMNLTTVATSYRVKKIQYLSFCDSINYF